MKTHIIILCMHIECKHNQCASKDIDRGQTPKFPFLRRSVGNDRARWLCLSLISVANVLKKGKKKRSNKATHLTPNRLWLRGVEIADVRCKETITHKGGLKTKWVRELSIRIEQLRQHQKNSVALREIIHTQHTLRQSREMQFLRGGASM